MLKSVVMAYHFIGPDGPTDNYIHPCILPPYISYFSIVCLFAEAASTSNIIDADVCASDYLVHFIRVPKYSKMRFNG